MAVKEKKAEGQDPKSESTSNEKKGKEPEKFFIVNEQDMLKLVGSIVNHQKLTWMDANPIITFIQQNFKEVKNDA